MPARLHPPVLDEPPDELGAQERRLIIETATRAIQRAAAEIPREVPVVWAEAAGAQLVAPTPPVAPVLPDERPQARERISPAGPEPWSDNAAIEVPSYIDRGAMVRLRLLPGIEVGGRDRVVQAEFPRRLVARAVGNSYFHAGGGPFAHTFNLARAIGWGRVLFGGRGFAVLHAPDGSPDEFFSVGLTSPLAMRELGRRGRSDRTGMSPIQAQPFSTDFETVLVETSDDAQLFTSDPAAPWSVEAIHSMLRSSPRDEARIDPAHVGLVGATLLATRDFDHSVEMLVNFDRSMFAAMPWERRAQYLRILVDAWTGEREEIAILELIHATRSTAELEAIFALLRQRGVYRRLFRDLDGRVFELLVMLGEFRGGRAPTWQYLVSVLVDAGLLNPTPLPLGADQNPIRELQLMVEGAEQWLRGMVEGLIELVSNPGQAIEGLAHLVELLWTFEKARWGDQQAQAVVAAMAAGIGRKVAAAMRGLNYVDELGTPMNARRRGEHASGDIVGRVKWMVVAEIASWFIGIGEIKAAMRGANVSERIAALARALQGIRLLGRLGRSGTSATRIERVLVALGRLAEIEDVARLARIAEALPDTHLQVLQRMAERVELPQGAGIEALRAALATEPRLQATLDPLADAFRATSRLEARAAAANSTLAELLPGFQRLMQDVEFEAGALSQLIADVPGADLRDFMRTVEFMSPDVVARLGPANLSGLARRPGAMNFLRDAGSELFDIVFRREGSDWTRMEKFVDGLERRRASLPSPDDWQRFLDRIRSGEQAALDEVADARRAHRLAEAEAASHVPQFTESRLRERGHQDTLDWFEDIPAGAERERYARELSQLSDRELDGLNEIAKLPEEQISFVGSIDDILSWDAQLRRDLLEIVAAVAPHADDTLGGVLHGILQRTRRGARLMQPGFQGSFGQLYAARHAVRDLGATSITFEVRLPGRHVDIEATIGGRTVHIEVKTPLVGGPGFETDELIFDLVNYATDNYRGLRYVYTPGTNITGVPARMRNHFNRPEVQQGLTRLGITRQAAEKAFDAWVATGVGHYRF